MERAVLASCRQSQLSRLFPFLKFVWPCADGSNSERHLQDQYNIRATIQDGAAKSGDK